MKKQTAVEWLVEKMLNQDWYTYKSLEYIQQANEMFEQQIIDAYDLGSLSDMQYPDPKTVIENGEHYYNVNFNN
jgi:hypothetical protein